MLFTHTRAHRREDSHTGDPTPPSLFKRGIKNNPAELKCPGYFHPPELMLTDSTVKTMITLT